MTSARPPRRTLGAGVVALALAAGTVPATGLVAPAADPVPVLTTDFSDGTWAPWTQNGDATLSVVDVEGDPALLVAGRAADYDGIKTPPGLLAPGGQYTFTMDVRLAEGTAGSAGVRFVAEPSYTWIGPTTMTADAWTTVTGTYTVPADADPATARVYLGTDALSTGPEAYSYLVDDIAITGTATDGPWTPTPDPSFVPGGATNPVATPVTAARGTGDVAALTFDDGPNPGETDRLLDFLAANELTATFCVIGQNIQAEGGAALLRRMVDEGHTLCNHTTSYADMGAWGEAEIEADLKANLAVIREALGDPAYPVPYFRAPNGSWGRTPGVAVALGMQPLGVVNVINDWETQDEATLTTNLRAALKPGELVLVHDGGGDRTASVAAVETVVGERLAEGWTFGLPAGGVTTTTGPVLVSDFEDGLGPWVPRGDADGDPVVAVTTTQAHGGAQSALVSGRTTQGDGIGVDLTGLVSAGTTYEISAWVRMADGSAADDVWLSLARTAGGTTSYDTVAQLPDVTAGAWSELTATYTVPEGVESAFLYLETSYNGGGSDPFLVDDVTIAPQGAPVVEERTPLKSTVDFPVGVAIDSRETNGAASELLLRHVDQITGENHMKPEAWYDEERAFRTHPEAQALMAFAQEEDLRVYGHTLVWHSQTPAWFFQHEDGTPLTTGEADKALLRERMRTHITSVAEALSTGGGYGLFGSPENPVVAFDVVNEVVSDGRGEADGLRRSEWYRVLGEEFIDLAFRYADEAFNGTYAAPGADRPVTLTINDYNTEQVGKQGRLHDLVERLLARGVPVDAVGHQFHVSLAMPVSALEDAIVAFQDLPVTQVVSELDVTTGTPVTRALLVEQGYYYRDVFRVFREHAEDLFSVTVWGLTDGRSWRSANGAPLLFDDALAAKPAFLGAVDEELPAPLRTALAFAGDVPLDGAATTAPAWAQLPLQEVAGATGFSVRWSPDHLTAHVRVEDGDVEAGDAVTFTVGDATTTVGRDGTVTSGPGTAVASPVEGGWAVVAHLPLAAAAEGDLVAFDVRVTDGATTTGWAGEGDTGTLTLVEPLSVTQVVQAPQAPSVDGVVEAAWATATSFRTEKTVSGATDGARATVRTLWEGDTLYLLAEVADPTLDATGSDPWIQDSVEVFLDAGNVKNGPYRYDDTQIRISYENAVSFGTGDEAFQQARVTSATQVVDGGYVVEAAIGLVDQGGLGTFHGLDVQVNDATAGARTAVTSWADPTGLGYQTTERWGVAELVGPPAEPEPVLDPVVEVSQVIVFGGDRVAVAVTGYRPGTTVDLTLQGLWPSQRVLPLGAVQVGSDGTGTTTVTIPRRAGVGLYAITGTQDDLRAADGVLVLPSRPSWLGSAAR
ncbi:endo-1,4-beta-xylanase [Cellulomonas marina]|uniref:Beta-xylanase n=1 Tax=Cellulomonas marina TaxID=988821 RepID=A0A1I0YMD3_9CELL|nr:endo-1,4-beta-xylanase [Cellulomonas marina]GIG27630.1 hypothetical protein Cma02nite_02300 [Cellulomonas marina]SFB14559.1 endo-1,4-beta-xylanase [Cellulomonas marina]